MDQTEIKVITKTEILSVLSKKMQEVYHQVENDIAKHTTDEEWVRHGITKKDKLIRIRFWRLLDESIYKGTKLHILTLINGVYSAYSFYEALKNPVRAAFIFTKPLDHRIQSMWLLEVAQEEIAKILNIDHFDSNGKVLGPVLTSKIKIWGALQDRVLGQTVQRIQQHNVNENKSNVSKLNNMDAIDAELAKLEESKKIELSDSEDVEVLDE